MRLAILALAFSPLFGETPEEEAAKLRAKAAAAPKLKLRRTELSVKPPKPGWELGMVSSVAVDRAGLIYLLQRGLTAEPIVVVDAKGNVVREWGKGLFKIPHSIRIGPDGSVWAVDAASSMIYKFTPTGKKLLEISVGEQPKRSSEFVGTADIAFGPGGRLFIADGYGNTRVLEYTADGKRVRQWGEFNLPHGITIDDDGVLYIADRENGRVQRFTLDGKFLSMIEGLGKTFSVTISGGALWIGTQPRNEPNGAPGWLMKLDRKTGAVLGVVESTGHHSIAVTAKGELLTGTRPNTVLWFRH
jgi:DNA-binding beta-propeller fold protein YncE